MQILSRLDLINAWPGASFSKDLNDLSFHKSDCMAFITRVTLARNYFGNFTCNLAACYVTEMICARNGLTIPPLKAVIR